MSKKINKEELKNVSGGGCGGGGNSDTMPADTFVCPSPTCGHTIKYGDAVRKNGNIYCPDCGAFVEKDANIDCPD